MKWNWWGLFFGTFQSKMVRGFIWNMQPLISYVAPYYDLVRQHVHDMTGLRDVSDVSSAPVFRLPRILV
jgi:hypothetical protein